MLAEEETGSTQELESESLKCFRKTDENISIGNLHALLVLSPNVYRTKKCID